MYILISMQRRMQGRGGGWGACAPPLFGFFFTKAKISINPGRHKGGGVNLNPPPIFLALNFCSLTDYQKLWHNCSLFVKTYFNPK